MNIPQIKKYTELDIECVKNIFEFAKKTKKQYLKTIMYYLDKHFLIYVNGCFPYTNQVNVNKKTFMFSTKLLNLYLNYISFRFKKTLNFVIDISTMQLYFINRPCQLLEISLRESPEKFDFMFKYGFTMGIYKRQVLPTEINIKTKFDEESDKWYEDFIKAHYTKK